MHIAFSDRGVLDGLAMTMRIANAPRARRAQRRGSDNCLFGALETGAGLVVVALHKVMRLRAEDTAVFVSHDCSATPHVVPPEARGPGLEVAGARSVRRISCRPKGLFPSVLSARSARCAVGQ